MLIRYGLPILLAVFCTAALAGCGGGENANLLSAGQAADLRTKVNAISTSVDSSDCSTAQDEVDEALAQVESLPKSIDRELVTNLRQWLGHIRTRVQKDCRVESEPIEPESDRSSTDETPKEEEPKPEKPAEKAAEKTEEQQSSPPQEEQPAASSEQSAPAEQAAPTPPTPADTGGATAEP